MTSHEAAMLTTAHDSCIFRQVGWQMVAARAQRLAAASAALRQTIGGVRVLWAWAAAACMLRQQSIDFLAPPCKRCRCGGSLLNFEQIACGL